MRSFLIIAAAVSLTVPNAGAGNASENNSGWRRGAVTGDGAWSWVLEVPQAVLDSAPRWRPADGECPLSPEAAYKKAVAAFQKLDLGAPTFHSLTLSVDTRGPFDIPVYNITFGSSKGCPVDFLVFLDGSVVSPKFEKRPDRARPGEPLVGERGLPEYFGASLDDAARVIARSDVIFEGVLQVDGETSEGRAIDVLGRVVCQRGLLTRGRPFPSALAFSRDISPVALSRGESSATAPFYRWDVAMNGVKVVAFAAHDNECDLRLLKVVPFRSEGVPELLGALELLAAHEKPSSNARMTGAPAQSRAGLLAEKVLARWRNGEAPGDATQ